MEDHHSVPDGVLSGHEASCTHAYISRNISRSIEICVHGAKPMNVLHLIAITNACRNDGMRQKHIDLATCIVCSFSATVSILSHGNCGIGSLTYHAASALRNLEPKYLLINETWQTLQLVPLYP